MATFKILSKNKFSLNCYYITPIKYSQRYKIMEWRNDQTYHLRQSSKLTKEDQDKYFDESVLPLYNDDRPNQLLFSFYDNSKFVAYGGLVHINWQEKNAEISFVIDTKLEKSKFHEYWFNFLGCIEQLAFLEISLHKLYVYAFDLRPHLYEVLVDTGYFKDAELKEHCLVNNSFHNVVIYSKIKDDS